MTDKAPKINMAVHLLLDCSGSMQGSGGPDAPIHKTREAANEFIRQLGMAASPPTITVTKFDGRQVDMITDTPVYRMPQIRPEDYQAEGGTDIHNAISRAIGKLDATDAELKAVIVMTDGGDGSGCDPATVARKVNIRQKKGWLFVYLGYNLPADWFEGAAANFGIPKELACAFSDNQISKVMAKVAEITLEYGATGSTKGAKI